MRLIDADKAYEVLTEYYHHRRQGQHDALLDAISRVPTIEVNRWIPVTEGLPERDGNYFVTYLGFGRKNTTVAWYGVAWWRDETRPCFYANGGEFDKILLMDVNAWMPLPEPWEESE